MVSGTDFQAPLWFDSMAPKTRRAQRTNKGMRQSNRRVDRSGRRGLRSYRFRAAHAAGVSSASRWMLVPARAGGTAAGENWIGINRWDPPAKYRLEQRPGRVRVEGAGEMPGVPGLQVTTAYEFPATEAALLVEESIEAQQDVRVRLLRLCEWSGTDGPANPFTHVAWADANGKTVVKVEVPRGSRYAIRYWLYCFRAEQATHTGKLTEAFCRRR